MKQSKIHEILENHKKWLNNNGGIQAYLRDADLTGADLTGADLRHANLRDADLTDADLRCAYLTGAYLRGADLTGAYLRDADLRDADLTGAELTDADLRCAYLTGAYLTGAYLTGAIMPKTDSVLLSPWGWCHVQREYIRIGCQYHTTEEWCNFSDEEIQVMASGAFGWWKQWKPVVMAMAEACEPYRGD